MGDTSRVSTDHLRLFSTAATQHGLFTRAQALACGIGDDLLTYHTRHGRFIRIHRGVYRLRDYPTSLHEDLAAAWLRLGKNVAVVSFESALDLLGLSDIITDGVHLTVPRAKRNLPILEGVRIHTTTRPLTDSEVTVREGIPVTSVTRTLVDVADKGTAPDQVELAVRQALERGLTTPGRLEQSISQRNRRVQDLIRGAAVGRD